MKIHLICVGETNENHVKAGLEVYLKRLKHYCSIQITEIKVKSKSTSVEVEKETQKEAILNKVSSASILILLDENGTQLTSRNFAGLISKKMNQGKSNITFVIGGAYGFHKELYQKADSTISLSKMTFPHQLVRLIFIEQLYRAFTILRNEKYHHD